MSKRPRILALAEPEPRPIDRPFLLLGALFLAALVVCNLIARKFVSVDVGFHTFEVSAGILPYPVTFLVTDLVSEMYGRRRANALVGAGFAASLFVLLVVWLGDAFPALAHSPITDADYRNVIATNAWRTVFASMLAYLVAQYVDVGMFEFWRHLTHGRHLWLRNNGSTLVSQGLDSALVVFILFAGDPQWPLEKMLAVIRDMWVFKAILALLDTPFFYAGVVWLQRWKPGPL